MRTRKVPLRQCIGCGARKKKKELVRIIKVPEGDILTDTSGKKNGRGAYICNSVSCLAAARKKHALDRAFKAAVPDSVFDEIEKELEKVADES